MHPTSSRPSPPVGPSLGLPRWRRCYAQLENIPQRRPFAGSRRGTHYSPWLPRCELLVAPTVRNADRWDVSGRCRLPPAVPASTPTIRRAGSVSRIALHAICSSVEADTYHNVCPRSRLCMTDGARGIISFLVQPPTKDCLPYSAPCTAPRVAP